jgi:hypothetical protein
MQGREPTAAEPAAKPAGTAPPAAPRQATAAGSKTAKDYTAEWRADKAGMQARGVTERSYVCLALDRSTPLEIHWL